MLYIVLKVTKTKTASAKAQEFTFGLTNPNTKESLKTA
jgi:hypothetical protein